MNLNDKGYMENLFTPGCIRLHSGVYINVRNVKEEQILIEDIAHALAMLPRWGGHCPFPYSVAEHSIYGSYHGDLTTNNERLEFLLHDATEAYLIDVPRPVKALFPEYLIVEDGIAEVMSKKWGLTYPLSDKIKAVDEHMLKMEWDNLILKGYRIVDERTHQQIKEQFLNRFNELI